MIKQDEHRLLQVKEHKGHSEALVWTRGKTTRDQTPKIPTHKGTWKMTIGTPLENVAQKFQVRDTPGTNSAPGKSTAAAQVTQQDSLNQAVLKILFTYFFA